MPESAICVQKETWSLNTRMIEKPIEVAHSVLANNYKGLGSGQIMNNGVIEWKQED